MNIAKYILPVLAGTISAMILITLGEIFLASTYHLGPTDSRKAIDISMVPAWAFIMLLVNYMVCSYLAGIVATVAAKRSTPLPAIVVGVVLTLAGIYNSLHIAHPAWFFVVNIVVYLPFTYVGYLTARRKAVGKV